MPRSHPSRVRELKLLDVPSEVDTEVSHLLWVRELKPQHYRVLLPRGAVAPLAGGWIQAIKRWELLSSYGYILVSLEFLAKSYPHSKK